MEAATRCCHGQKHKLHLVDLVVVSLSLFLFLPMPLPPTISGAAAAAAAAAVGPVGPAAVYHSFLPMLLLLPLLAVDVGSGRTKWLLSHRQWLFFLVAVITV